MNENSFIKDIGRSYIVSSFLPTALFIAVGLLIFRGFIPKLLSARLIEQDIFYTSQWFLFAAFTSWLAFGLYSGVNSIIQLYEGYGWPEFISQPFKEYLTLKFGEKKTSILAIFKTLDEKQSASELSFDELIEFGETQEKAKFEYLELENLAPIDHKNLLPTRLGNILRACEIYPMEKYSIPGVILWPRLLQLLPKELKDQIEERFNQLVFALNTSFLAYVIGILAISVGLLRLPCQAWKHIPSCHYAEPTNFFERGFTNLAPTEYMLIGLLFILVGYLAYCVSIPITQNFGLLIRTSYDLYRFDLLRKLNHRLPKNIKEEKNFWQKITEYMIAGDRLGFETPDITYSIRKELFDYREPPKRKPSKKKEAS